MLRIMIVRLVFVAAVPMPVFVRMAVFMAMGFMTVLVLMMTMASFMSMIVRFVLVIMAMFLIMFSFVCHCLIHLFTCALLPILTVNTGYSHLRANYPIRPFPFKVRGSGSVQPKFRSSK